MSLRNNPDPNKCRPITARDTHSGKHFRAVNNYLTTISTRATKAKQKKKPWNERRLLSEISGAESALRSRLIDMADPIKLQSSDPLKPSDPNPTSLTF